MGDLFDLTGHVALVTGGNSGIGLGMADGLAAQGADVAIWGTNEAKNEAAAEQLSRHGTKVLALKCDVGDEAEVEASFAATVDTLGKVDSCFAERGDRRQQLGVRRPHRRRVAPSAARQSRRRVLHVARAVRHMVERGEGGSLAVTTSGSTMMGAPRNEPYASSKGAVIALMKGIAVEHAATASAPTRSFPAGSRRR